MLLDQNAVLSDKQAVTATAASQNVIDMTAAGNAAPGALFAVCRVDETFAGITKLEVALQTAEKADFSDAEELVSASFAVAALTAGETVLAVGVPAGVKRYMRAYYTATGTGTAGKLSFFLTDAVDMK